MKNLIIILMITFSLSSYSQILTSESFSFGSAANSFAFIDASSSVGFNPFLGAGKGILFPQTDITNVDETDIFDSGTIGSPSNNPNFYDGLIVFNTGSGTTTLGNPVTVEPGFYYYSNPNASSIGTGEWKPLGGGGDGRFTISPTPVETNTVTPNGNVFVVEVSGTTDGTSTTLDLSTDLSGIDVFRFRRAYVYNSNDELVIQATNEFDNSSKILTTGDGSVNKLLPSGTYTVEFYYVPAP